MDAWIDDGLLVFARPIGDGALVGVFDHKQLHSVMVFLLGMLASGTWNGDVEQTASLKRSAEAGWVFDRADLWLSDQVRRALLVDSQHGLIISKQFDHKSSQVELVYRCNRHDPPIIYSKDEYHGRCPACGKPVGPMTARPRP